MARRSAARRVRGERREVVERRAPFGGRGGEKMQVKFEAFGDVREGRPGARQNGLGKYAGVGNRQRSAAAIGLDRGGDQHGVAIGGTGARLVDGDDVTAPGRAAPGTKPRRESSSARAARASPSVSARGGAVGGAGSGQGSASAAGAAAGEGRNGVLERQHRTISMRAAWNKSRTKDGRRSSLLARGLGLGRRRARRRRRPEPARGWDRRRAPRR